MAQSIQYWISCYWPDSICLTWFNAVNCMKHLHTKTIILPFLSLFFFLLRLLFLLYLEKYNISLEVLSIVVCSGFKGLKRSTDPQMLVPILNPLNATFMMIRFNWESHLFVRLRLSSSWWERERTREKKGEWERERERERVKKNKVFLTFLMK